MTDFDWSFTEDDEVLDTIERTTARVATRFGVDEADLGQEALILVADPTKNLAECVREGNLGLLSFRLDGDLSNLAKQQVVVADRHESFEDRYEEGYPAAPVVLRREVSRYDREIVESLLPSVWDDSYCYGIRQETAPDPDMPRGSTNKATGNALGAHVADVQRAWLRADLTRVERRALFLTYAMGWTQVEIAAHEGVTQQAVHKRLYTGVGRLVVELNGDEGLREQLDQEVAA